MSTENQNKGMSIIIEQLGKLQNENETLKSSGDLYREWWLKEKEEKEALQLELESKQKK